MAGRHERATEAEPDPQNGRVDSSTDAVDLPGGQNLASRFPQVPGVRLEDEIGFGGFATVYRGHQLSVERDVAVKVDQRRLVEARDQRRFAREITAAGAVSAHPHIVTLYDGGTTQDDHPYLVMELYSGGSYADRIRAFGAIAFTEVLDVGFGIADALVAAHSEGILHRDVKPGNILISRYGTAALADFGLAALPSATEGYSVTMESLTPSYAAPEAFGGMAPTASMDIYALGATLYAMLQGRPPRSDAAGVSPPIARLLMLLNEPLPAIDAPGADDLMPVIWRATAINPVDRYPTAADLRDALAAVRSGRPHSAGGIRPFASTAAGPAAGAAADREDTGNGHRAGSTDSGLESISLPPAAKLSSKQRIRPRLMLIATALIAVLAVVVAGALVAGGRGTVAGQALRAVSGVARDPNTTSSPRPATSPKTSPGTASPSVATAGGKTSVTPDSAEPATTSSATSSSTPKKSAAAPAKGSCWMGLVSIGQQTTANAVKSCGKPHRWEAYATGILDPTTASPSTTDVAKDPVVIQTCTKDALIDYLGPDQQGTFDVDVLPPSPTAFAQGNRGFWCLVSEYGKGDVTGSLRG